MEAGGVCKTLRLAWKKVGKTVGKRLVPYVRVPHTGRSTISVGSSRVEWLQLLWTSWLARAVSSFAIEGVTKIVVYGFIESKCHFKIQGGVRVRDKKHPLLKQIVNPLQKLGI